MITEELTLFDDRHTNLSTELAVNVLAKRSTDRYGEITERIGLKELFSGISQTGFS